MAGVRVGVVVIAVAAACNSSLDAQTESARSQVLALDSSDAARVVAFCKSWRGSLHDFPLAVKPTSASATGGVITFAWWNNSHAEEDDPHPGFELICSEPAIAGGKSIAAGLWYRDAPMNRDD